MLSANVTFKTHNIATINCSPLLLNIALHGMEDTLNIIYDKYGRINPKSEYALVKYADDFVICAKTKEA